ncbi:hypothetical protein [Sinobaca sp. H24]|uniref:hypothetical protein n=1 Tax=Sinobaca sp. H24 TaxID=2923376 RepID=UPI00207AFF1E|nr:hypothetical protein [Sinobaca sp. H24]
MDKVNNVKIFAELYDLVLFYKENRDLPTDENFNFFEEVEKYCEKLNLDYETFTKEFHLTKGL